MLQPEKTGSKLCNVKALNEFITDIMTVKLNPHFHAL